VKGTGLAEFSGIRSEVVICTKNRPEELARALDSLSNAASPLRVLVVDASDDERTHEAVQAWDSTSRNTIRYLRSAPGLTKQRMVGIQNLNAASDIVHFIDDDVVVEPTYFIELQAAFDALPEIVGAGGKITNHPRRIVRRLWIAAGLDSPRQGVMLPSGVHTFMYDADGITAVDWLSGCAMSYRTRVFERLSFDTRLSGACVGEDVDFSFRALREGGLVHVPTARLAHYPSSTERMRLKERYVQDLLRRHQLVCESQSLGLSRRRFWLSAFGEVALCVGEGLVLRRRSMVRQGIARAKGILLILCQVLRNRAGEKKPLF
jgi:GT2 family glycosyltransferase